ncbi:MAG: S8 family peptidase [Rubrobacteraceae bacterium]
MAETENTKTYIYSCRVIPPEERDVARAYQRNPREMHHAEIGEMRQLSVDLTDEGAQAYARSSNLIEIEEETEAVAEGWVERGTELMDEVASVANFPAIPPTEDTNYGRSTWLRSSAGKQGAGVKVAVLDTALGAATARMLRNYIVGHKSWVGGSALGGNNDHGSHCACTALPDKAKLLHGAVLANNGSGGTSGVIAAIHWAVDSGADIISMSLSGPGNEAAYEQAIRRARDKGVLVFCASGNEAQKGNPKRFPGGCRSAIAVGAFDRASDRRASFSCHGAHVDIAHSGVSVLSYSARATLIRMSGTSQATPNVAWTAAGLLAETGKRGDALLAGLLSGARKNGSAITHYGAGIADAQKSKGKLLIPSKPPKPEPQKPEPPEPNGSVKLFPLLKGR